jgi:WD40 repeat protein
MFRFTTRDVLWLTAVVALMVTLWVTRGTQIGARRHSPDAAPPDAPPPADVPARASPRTETLKPPAAAADTPGAPASSAAGALAQFGDHSGPVRHLKLSPDGRQLLSCSSGSDGAAALRLWDTATGKLIHSFAASSAQIADIGFAPDGKRIMAASPSAIQLWDLDGREVARQWVGEGIVCLDIGPQLGIAALGLRSGDVVIWDYAAGIEIRRLRGHTRPVRAVAFTSGGERLTTAADDQTLRLWDVATGASLAGRSTPQVNTDLEDRKVAQAENELAAARLARDEYLSGTFVQEEKRLLSEIFVAQQNLLAAERGVQSSKRLIEKGIVTIKQLEGAQTIAENARQILDLWQKNLDTLRNYTRPRMLQDCDNKIAIAQAALLAEEGRLADERIAQGAGCFARLATPIRAVAVSPDGKLIAATQESAKADAGSLDGVFSDAPAVVVFDAETGEVHRELRGSGGTLPAIAFTPSGKSLLAGGSERVVFQWDLATGELIRQQPMPEAVADLVVASDGQRLFTAGASEKKPLSPNPPPGSNYPIRVWPLAEN